MTCPKAMSRPTIDYPSNDVLVIEVGVAKPGRFGGPHIRRCYRTFILVIFHWNKFFRIWREEALADISRVGRIYIGTQRGVISSELGSDFCVMELSYVRNQKQKKKKKRRVTMLPSSWSRVEVKSKTPWLQPGCRWSPGVSRAQWLPTFIKWRIRK